MADETLVAYIRDSLAAGHDEAVVREHLLQSGWQSDVLQAAFAAVQPQSAAQPRNATAPKPRRGSRVRTVRWTRRWQVKLAACLVVLGVGAFVFYRYDAPKPAPVHDQPIRLTTQQRQANDISTIAGAIGQYAAANKVLPITAAPSGGQLVLCDTVCNPLTAQVAALVIYHADQVKIVAYRAALTATSTQVIYLVPQAKCDGGAVGGPNPNPRSMVLLYDAATTPNSTPRCIVL